MTGQTFITTEQASFKDFIFNNHRYKFILWLTAALTVILFSIFKYLYPFANYIHGDSFSYIKAADQNLSINTYLIGYSKFLRLFSVFSNSDFVLVAFQYLFIQVSGLFFSFSIFYFYKTGWIAQIVLLCFMVLNPLFLHLANLISSDGLFLALSLIWFSLLLWIIHKPSKAIIIWHSIFLFLAFTVRYNAIIYPFIAIVAFYLSKVTVRQKFLGLASGILLCGAFAMFMSYEYKKLTGYWQYSPFSGWQLTNNAMYAYRYVKPSDRMPVIQKFQPLDNMIREYFDTTKNTKIFWQETLIASTAYMWSKKLTLYKYRDSLFSKDTSATEMKKWASMGPFYKEYGLYLIKKYPGYFARHFLWPNTIKYFSPPVEFLEAYNSGKDTVNKIARSWFNYKSKYINTRTDDNRIWTLDFYPILSGIINALMICTLIFYLVLKGWTFHATLSKGLLIGSMFWFVNAIFTIFASSAALRFQSFPIVITTTNGLLLLNWMFQLMKATANNEKNKLNTHGKGEKGLQYTTTL